MPDQLGTGINPDNKLLDGHGLGTVLGLLKTQMAADYNNLSSDIYYGYVAKSSVTPVLASGTTIARIDGKTIYAPIQESSVYYAELEPVAESVFGFADSNDTFDSIKAKIESGTEVILKVSDSYLDGGAGYSYAYLVRTTEENQQLESADCLSFATDNSTGRCFIFEVYSNDEISIGEDLVNLSNIYGSIVTNIVPSLTAGVTIGTVTTKALSGNYTSATLYIPSVDTSSFVPATTTNGNVKTQFITQSSTTGMTLRISDGNPNTHQALLRMESTNESYPKTKAQLLADDILIQGTTLTLQGVKTPTNNTDAANKKYVDDTVAAITSTIDPESVYYVDAEWVYNPQPVMSANPTRDGDVVAKAISIPNSLYYTISFSNPTIDNYDSIKAKIDAGKNVVLRINTTVLPDEDRDVVYAILQSESSQWGEDDADVLTFASFENGVGEFYSIVTDSYSPIIYSAVPIELSNTKGMYVQEINPSAESIGGITIAYYSFRDEYDNEYQGELHSPAQVNADWNATTGVSTILNKPDLNNYVLTNSVISTGPTNGTAIANISGVTIYAPVAQGGVTVESDPVFTAWATGNGIAAYTITASDVARWNGITGYVPKEVTGGTITFVPGEFAVDIQDQNENLSSIAATTNSVEIWVGEGATESAAAMMMNIQNDGAHLELNAQHISIASTDTRISGVTTPTRNTDAANKKYVDDQISGVTTGLTNYVPKQVIGSTTATTITVGSDGFKVEAFTNNQENISSVSVNPVNGKIELTAGEYANEHYAGIELGGENGKSYIYMQANDVAISGVTTPTYPLDAANKSYVDDSIASAVTPYVAKTDVTPAAGITGTVIATIGGKTIYAPVSEEGIQSETDPVFSASAAYGITATDIANWNAKSSTTPVNADWNATTGLSSILNKPNLGTAATVAIGTFATASHTHDYSKVSATRAFSSGTALATITIDSSSVTINVPNASASTAGITKVGASGGAAAYSHTHSYSDITGLGTAATTAITDYATASHSHSWSNITNPPASYTPTAHTHDYSKVSVTAVTTTGITIGTATVNNNGTTTTTTLYAPFSIVYDGTNTALVFEGF